MDPPATRIFTPARIVALALIALAVLGPGYLRFAPHAGAVPAGLGIYLAWVNRDWSATAKTTGFAAAAAGALVCARLGFHATTGFLALITAIAAAAAGANLLLLALDISRDRQARSRFTGTNAKRALEAHPAAGQRAPGRASAARRQRLFDPITSTKGRWESWPAPTHPPGPAFPDSISGQTPAHATRS